MNKVLIVDDDIAICKTLQMHFRQENFEVELAHNANDGINIAKESHPQLIILDIKMPSKTGIEALPEFKMVSPQSRIIMITAFHDMKSTIDAMKKGADDYIHKPIDLAELDAAVNKTMNICLAHQDSLELDNTVEHEIDGNIIVGHTKEMKDIFKTIGLIAKNPATVLITGESGTGKELVAKAVHHFGSNPEGPFVAINCASIVETLLESDMFGHEKGAFTGAVSKQKGKFELADDGTIFLDEIGDMQPEMQAKLLRVLQEKEITPIGSNRAIKINARIIAATNADLDEKVKSGEFREDLFYRLQVVNIHVPPLRERMEDLSSLVEVLLRRINKEFNTMISGISKESINSFYQYDWPGNVRELENTLIKVATVCPGDFIDLSLIPSHISQSSGDKANQSNVTSTNLMSLSEVEKAHTLKILNENNWHKGKACEILGVSRPRLRRLIAQYNLQEQSH